MDDAAESKPVGDNALALVERASELHQSIRREMGLEDAQKQMDERTIQRLEVKALYHTMRAVYHWRKAQIVNAGDWWSLPGWWLLWERNRLLYWSLVILPRRRRASAPDAR